MATQPFMCQVVGQAECSHIYCYKITVCPVLVCNDININKAASLSLGFCLVSNYFLYASGEIYQLAQVYYTAAASLDIFFTWSHIYRSI